MGPEAITVSVPASAKPTLPETGVRLDAAEAVAAVFREMLSSPESDKDFFATILRAERAAGLDGI